MNWVELITTMGGFAGVMGGFEGFKWFFNRKHNKRIAQAKADQEEAKANIDEFHYLKERIEIAEAHNKQKEERFHEQTLLVRDLNKQLLDKAIENGTLNAEISALKAERALKLCERRGCKDRQPQSGF
jgi:hypothetical protein